MDHLPGVALAYSGEEALVELGSRYATGHGPVAVAAYGISARLEFLTVPLAFGVGSALTALVGRAAGAAGRLLSRDLDRAHGGAARAAE